MQEVPADTNAEIAAAPNSVPLQPLLSPTSLRTPTNATSLGALQQKLEERQRGTTTIDPYFQKVFHAVEQAIVGKQLLEVRCKDLMQQNNKKKTRQHMNERKIGEAKITGYEEIVEALRARDRKEAKRERERERKKAAKNTTNKVMKPRATKSEKRTKRIVASESDAEAVETSTYCSVFPVEPAGEVATTQHFIQAMDIPTGDIWPMERSGEDIPWQAPVAPMY